MCFSARLCQMHACLMSINCSEGNGLLGVFLSLVVPWKEVGRHYELVKGLSNSDGFIPRGSTRPGVEVII